MRPKKPAACGTALSYRRGCRCKMCSKANAECERDRRAGKRPVRKFRKKTAVGLRHCTKCDVVKPISSFAPNKTRKDNLSIWCKGCVSVYGAVYYADDPEGVITRTSNNRRIRVANGSTRERDSAAAYRAEHAEDLEWAMSRRLSDIKKPGHRSRRGVTITVNDLIALYIAQGGICALSGRPLRIKASGRKDPGVLSIDRRDNTKGYHLDNIRLVTWEVNLALSGWGTTHLLDLCRDIVANQETSNASMG